MEQSPQNPGAPAQDSAVQGSPSPENTAQSNAAESTAVESYCGTYRNRPPEPRARPRRRWCRLHVSQRSSSDPERSRRAQAHGPVCTRLYPGCGSARSIYRRDTSNVAVPDVYDRS